MRHRNTCGKKTYRTVALIFVEGDTEVEFITEVQKKYFLHIPQRHYNLNGKFKVSGKILDKTYQYILEHPQDDVRLYCFIDRDSITGDPPIDVGRLQEKINDDSDLRSKVLSVEAVIATQMIESWFFHDIDGIYKFLSAPVHKRKPLKFAKVENFNADDLAKLFKSFGKTYIKGRRCHNFVQHLDIKKIYSFSAELRTGVNLIVQQMPCQ